MRPSLPTTFLCLTIVLASCSGEEDRREMRAPAGWSDLQLLPYDSLLLGDRQVFIGEPGNLVVVPGDTRGILAEIWVSDWFNRTVFRFRGDGAFDRRVGRPGSGPGEFSTVGLVFLTEPDASTGGEVGVFDSRVFKIEWFDRSDGDHIRTLRYGSGHPGGGRPAFLGPERELMAFPLVGLTSRTSIGIWEAGSDSIVKAGPLPDSYLRSLESGSFYAFVASYHETHVTAVDAETVLVGAMGDDALLLYRHREDRHEVLGRLPTLYRRGVPEDLQRAVDSPEHALPGSSFEWASLLLGLWTTADGEIVAVHSDQYAEGEIPSRPILTAELFLSVLDPNTDLACVDVAVRGGREVRPVVDVSGGFLFVLDRRLTEAHDAEAWLLSSPLPSIEDCPSEHLVEGWIGSPG